MAGQFGGWTPIGAEQTASGYEVAWKVAGADQYTVWNTDSSGNYVSNAIGVVSGSSTALESLETSFHQDLNGDGVIGLPTTVIEAIGSTSLTQVGIIFILSGGSGPELKYAGAAVVAGQFGGLDADRRGADGKRLRGGLEGRGRRSVYGLEYRQQRQLSSRIRSASCREPARRWNRSRPAFHQDLNGDGVIGIPTTVIEAIGSTSLIEIGNNFYL